MHQGGDGLLLDGLDHGEKQVIALLFILIQRIFLAVAAQANTLAEMIHAKKMVLPVVVHHLQKHNAFEITHMLVTEFGLTHDAIEEDRGGLIWLEDVVSAFDDRQLGYVFYTYHSNSMGLYGNEAELPSDETAVTPLIEFFAEQLAE